MSIWEREKTLKKKKERKKKKKRERGRRKMDDIHHRRLALLFAPMADLQRSTLWMALVFLDDGGESDKRGRRELLSPKKHAHENKTSPTSKTSFSSLAMGPLFLYSCTFSTLAQVPFFYFMIFLFLSLLALAFFLFHLIWFFFIFTVRW